MRSKFTTTDEIPVSEIMLDQGNFRIGQAESQAECIDLLFHEFGDKMLRIADHISKEGLSPKPIVVKRNDKGVWVVRDGNRRVASLKLLNNPALAPEEHRRKFLELKQRDAGVGNIPSAISCLASEDEDVILKYMQLEHLGPQDGVGQVDWGPRAKDNMSIAIGGKPRDAIARAVCDYLEKKGTQEAKTVKITNIQRLLQDIAVQQQLGIALDSDKLVFLRDEDDVRVVLTEIILDFSSRGRKVDDIYHSEDRKRYVEDLFNNRGLKRPSPKQPSSTHITSESSQITTSSGPSASSLGVSKTVISIPVPTRSPQDRARLIPRGAGLNVPETEAKVLKIIHELSRTINVREAPLSAAVMLRLLLEYSVGYYCDSNSIIAPKGNELYKKINQAALHMENKRITKQQRELLGKMGNSNELFSAHTLNQYVHSPVYIPTSKEICAYWDCIYFFLRACWE
jgi:hypothetical protein